MTSPRKIAIVTGAAGGMGRLCSIRLADRYRLVLNEFREGPLADTVRMLEDDRAEVVAAVPGDLGSPGVLRQIVAACGNDLGAVVHTAGQAPQTAGWRAILDTNIVATARLLDALVPVFQGDQAVILIASIARLLVFAPPAGLLEVLEDPLDPGFADKLESLLGADDQTRAMKAYCWSKWWVHRETQRRAIGLGPRGVRIMSISPGMIWTPMGRAAVGAGTTNQLLEQTPMQRWGAPADIVNAVEFILSDRASFLTGSDILVDGGVGAALRTGGIG